MGLQATDPGIEIELQCGAEDLPIEGNASATGDDIQDQQTYKWIRDQLESGNDWAWCTAIVRVTYRDAIAAESYLGGCSYLGADDFRAGGYYDDMVRECLLEIDRKLAVLCGPKKGS
jgi:hypothetical protein